MGSGAIEESHTSVIRDVNVHPQTLLHQGFQENEVKSR